MASFITEKEIELLEKAKQLLIDIKQLDDRFSLSNVLEINKESILIFKCNCFLKEDYKKEIENRLADDINCRCILLTNGIELDKAMSYGIDINCENKDYKTVTFCDKFGNGIKEETTQ